MKDLIKRLIFAYKYKRAVKKAIRLQSVHRQKFMVIYAGGKLKVVRKQTIKELVKRHKFRKGVKIQDIEKTALFITK